jgi:crystallin alpha B
MLRILGRHMNEVGAMAAHAGVTGTRSLHVYRSPFHFFDSFIANQVRQMDAEMERMRRHMFQLVPPELLMTPPSLAEHEQATAEERRFEIEPQVPIVDDNGQRKLKMQFNVKDYKPEEVQVKMLENNVLQVCANHEEKLENGQTRRRLFIRQYRLPKGVEVDQLKPSLSQDGVLTVEAPAPSLQPTERLIPIEYTKPTAQVGDGEKK